MANVVKIKRSDSTGNVPTLVSGEIAINQKDKKLFFLDDLGVVQSFDMAATIINDSNGTALGSVTGTLANTIAYSSLVPQWIVNARKSFKIEASILKSLGSGSCTVRIYMNNSISLTGAKLISTTTVTATQFGANIIRTIMTGGSAGYYVYYSDTTSAFHDYLGYAAYASGSLNFSPCYIIVAFQLGVVGEQGFLTMLKLSR